MNGCKIIRVGKAKKKNTKRNDNQLFDQGKAGLLKINNVLYNPLNFNWYKNGNYYMYKADYFINKKYIWQRLIIPKYVSSMELKRVIKDNFDSYADIYNNLIKSRPGYQTTLIFDCDYKIKLFTDEDNYIIDYYK
jgi:hypothetical protein